MSEFKSIIYSTYSYNHKYSTYKSLFNIILLYTVPARSMEMTDLSRKCDYNNNKTLDVGITVYWFFSNLFIYLSRQEPKP